MHQLVMSIYHVYPQAMVYSYDNVAKKNRERVCVCVGRLLQYCSIACLGSMLGSLVMGRGGGGELVQSCLSGGGGGGSFKFFLEWGGGLVQSFWSGEGGGGGANLHM